MKRILILLLLTLCVASAQSQLDGERNLPRAGDDLMKEQVVYCKPGESGENRIWDFSKIELYRDVEENGVAFIVHYFTRDDWKIIGAENGKLTFLEIKNDSLLVCGYETSSQLVKYSLHGLLLHFPVVYGDISYGDFFGRGKQHDRLELIVSGEIRTEADATGVLVLPGGDRLTDITRVHIRKIERSRYIPITSEFSVSRSANESYFSNSSEEVITTNTYQWYEKGYRYPVFETIEKYRDFADGRVILRQESYLCHPADHAYLSEDTANLVVHEHKQNVHNSKMLEKEDNIISFSCYPNPVKEQLVIDLALLKEAKVEAVLLDMSGRFVARFPTKSHVTHYRETLNVASYPAGYYMVKVTSENETVSEKIVKN